MSRLEKEWLPHLEDSIPDEVNGDKLSMYSIALEGWRRGLTTKFYNTKYGKKYEINYSLSNKEKELKFAVSKGPNVSKEAMKICKNKVLTKEYLSEANVSVPKGRNFNKNHPNEEIIEYAKTLGFPVVIKPVGANLGKGVIPNINNIKEFKTSLIQVRDVLGYRDIIVEQHIFGEEYRVYVVNDMVIGAINRLPANVIGDGKSTINQLIRKKNYERKQNPNLRGRSIKIDTEVKKNIKQANYTLDSILKKDELLYLRQNSNVSTGGEPIDVTGLLTEEMKELAVNACRAVPGLSQAGVDILFDINRNHGVVIELNTRPGIGSHLFPVKGQARDIPKAVIDYYFPETIDYDRKTHKNKIFYDYKAITELLSSGIAQEVVLPDCPQYDMVKKRYTVSGQVQKVGYRRWVQRMALNNRLIGTVENLDDGTVLIHVAGKESDIDNFHSTLNIDKPKRAKVDKVVEEADNRPISAIGFEIITKKKEASVSLKKTDRKAITKYENEIQELKKQRREIEKKHNNILQSNWWKYTTKVKQLIKK
ncbi:acylphosphatase [Ornithinibacillus halotolerans]|uniref:acylphosphatase n=1 Tax=Ornithinibacillus halotolerans TaxID=1274357 RepID=A0A916RQA0_9BACI|nr:acylphosphatase [Ornithinibacillus halotolerans]GGA64760.1 hypothetical protein GCM10008025_05740 [Ornithinibacillus halotolerans]